MTKPLRFKTIVFGGAEDKRQDNALQDAILYGGRNLETNPRSVLRVTTNSEIPGRVTWEMRVGNAADKTTYFRVVEVSENALTVEWPPTDVVLVIKFGGQERNVRLGQPGTLSKNIWVLIIPPGINDDCLRSLANKIIADLVVTGFTETSFNSSIVKQPKDKSHRTRGHRNQHETI